MKNFFLVIMIVIISFFSFLSCTVYETRHVYTPVPDYYTLRVYDNRYVYYNGSEPVAVWTFGDDGVCVKEGIVINGPVRVYSRPGVLFAEANYVDGARDGMCRYYYPDGVVMYSGYYRMGHMSGGWNSYRNNGEISASYQFHGNETQMPANFTPPSDSEGRHGFNSMQMESSYADKRVVARPSINAAAIPQHSANSFGAVSTQGAVTNQVPGQGQNRMQETKSSPAAGTTINMKNKGKGKPGKQSGIRTSSQDNKHGKNEKKHGDKQGQGKLKIKPAPKNIAKETKDNNKENQGH
jgi:hypothetical protein